jgi:hypothetical protein
MFRNKRKSNSDNLNTFIYKLSKLKQIKNDKIIYNTHKLTKKINIHLFDVLFNLNKLTDEINNNKSYKYLIDELNKIKNNIFYVNDILVVIRENKAEIDYISEIDSYNYEYKLASSYLDNYMICLFKIYINIENKILYIESLLEKINVIF